MKDEKAMNEIDQIQQIIDEINQRTSKNYHEMGIDELSSELRNIMEFEQEIFQKIENLERKKIDLEWVKYTKTICRNTTQRKISEIQEKYLKKIDEKYLKDLKK